MSIWAVILLDMADISERLAARNDKTSLGSIHIEIQIIAKHHEEVSASGHDWRLPVCSVDMRDLTYSFCVALVHIT